MFVTFVIEGCSSVDGVFPSFACQAVLSSKLLKQARYVAQFVECLPSMHTEPRILSSAPRKPTVVPHACDPSTRGVEGG